MLDAEKQHVLIMDPSETSEPPHEMKSKHEGIATKIMKNLQKCILEHIDGWVLPTRGWSFEYNVGMHASCDR